MDNHTKAEVTATEVVHFAETQKKDKKPWWIWILLGLVVFIFLAAIIGFGIVMGRKYNEVQKNKRTYHGSHNPSDFEATADHEDLLIFLENQKKLNTPPTEDSDIREPQQTNSPPTSKRKANSGTTKATVTETSSTPAAINMITDLIELLSKTPRNFTSQFNDSNIQLLALLRNSLGNNKTINPNYSLIVNFIGIHFTNDIKFRDFSKLTEQDKTIIHNFILDVNLPVMKRLLKYIRECLEQTTLPIIQYDPIYIRDGLKYQFDITEIENKSLDILEHLLNQKIDKEKIKEMTKTLKKIEFGYIKDVLDNGGKNHKLYFKKIIEIYAKILASTYDIKSEVAHSVQMMTPEKQKKAKERKESEVPKVTDIYNQVNTNPDKLFAEIDEISGEYNSGTE